MRSSQISQISHFQIKYEYGVFHLKEEISRHAFFFSYLFYTLRIAFVIKAGEFLYLLRNPFFFFQIQFNHISKTAWIYLDHHSMLKF